MDEVIAREVPGLRMSEHRQKPSFQDTHWMLGIFKENLCRICDAKVLLRLCASAIDTRRRFGGTTPP